MYSLAISEYLKEIGSSIEIKYSDSMIKMFDEANTKTCTAIAKLMKENKVLKKCLEKMIEHEGEKMEEINSKLEKEEELYNFMSE